MAEVTVHISPTFAGPDIKGDGGIRRVVEAQKRHLPSMGIKLIDKPDDADLVAVHAASTNYMPTGGQKLIAHSHGLYWKEYEWAPWHYQMNGDCIRIMLNADVITAPSEWVANSLRRGMNVSPVVLWHGVDPEDYPESMLAHGADENGEYVLWNKARIDPVCDPSAMIELARMAPDINFVSTFGGIGEGALDNVVITGQTGHADAVNFVRHAGVYLATTRETFGVGTLEAMALGVPVLGWDWGGQHEFIRHRETGWLSRPGDFNDLLEGLRFCLKNRNAMGKAARNQVMTSMTWQQAMLKYADLYTATVGSSGRPSPRVSIIITCYNLERFLSDAIESVLGQDFQDFEIIVIDDASPNERGFATAKEIVDRYTEPYRSKIHLLRNSTNQYLAGALNIGIHHAVGDYIIPLDADNMLGPDSLGLLVGVLDDHRELDIAYGAMEYYRIDEDGKELDAHQVSDWPPKTFSLQGQLSHRNQIPSTSIYRKKIWERVGGYRSRCKTAEDADFWCRATSFGARAARVGDFVSLIYRDREHSMSRSNRDWPWEAWYPWKSDRAITPYGASVDTKYRDELNRNVSAFEPPLVSVIIPVGPGHEKYIVDALDSVRSQTFQKWECILVDDTGGNLSTGEYWVPSWARVVDSRDHDATGILDHRIGPAHPRNVGISAAHSGVFVLLDADDFLQPSCLERMYDTWLEHKGYVYTDWRCVENDEVNASMDYDANTIFQRMQHSVTVMCSVSDWTKAGGFDEKLDAWEDWDFFISLAAVGVCGTRIPEPLLNYRYKTGMMRELHHSKLEEMKANIYSKWKDYIDGAKRLMACAACSGGGGGKVTPMSDPPSVNEALAGIESSSEEWVVVQFIQPDRPSTTYRGPRTGREYRFGSDEGHNVHYVHVSDAPFFEAMPAQFKKLSSPAATRVLPSAKLEAAGVPA